jgi:hypothetical protein
MGLRIETSKTKGRKPQVDAFQLVGISWRNRIIIIINFLQAAILNDGSFYSLHNLIMDLVCCTKMFTFVLLFDCRRLPQEKKQKVSPSAIKKNFILYSNSETSFMLGEYEVNKWDAVFCNLKLV